MFCFDARIHDESLQHQGFVVAGAPALIIMACYNQKVSERVLRVAFGLGIALPLAVFFFRIRMINSMQYRKHASTQKDFYTLALRRYWKLMLGTELLKATRSNEESSFVDNIIY